MSAADLPSVRAVLDELTDAERERLASGLAVDARDLPAYLDRIAAAAAREYLDLFLGRRIPSTAKESRELRLLLLVQHVFRAMPPTTVVSDLFQLTTSQARTLVRNTRTRFRFELTEVLEAAVAGFLDAGERRGDVLVVEIRDEALVEYVKEAVLRGEGNPPQIEPDADTHRYIVRSATERVLRRVAGRAEPSRRR